MRKTKLPLALLLVAPFLGGVLRCVGGDDSVIPDVADTAIDNTTTPDTGPSDAPTTTDGDADASTCNVDNDGGSAIDQTFANGTKTNVGNFGPNGAAVDSKGRIYVVGAQNNTCNGTGLAGQVYRFTNDGNLDTTFGATDGGSSSNGVCIHYDVGDSSWSIAIDESTDRVYVGGFAFDGAAPASHFHATITALHQDGSFDTTFFSTGKRDLNPQVDAGNSSFAVVDGISLWTTKIILTGSTDQIQGTGGHGRNTGFITRLNHDGTTDSFGLIADTDVFGYYGTVIDTAGVVTGVGTLKPNGDAGNTAQAFGVRQWNANGQRAASFGSGGTAYYQFNAGSEPRDIVSMNGRFLVGGGVNFALNRGGTGGRVAIVAFTPTGAVDTTWSAADGGIEGGAGQFFSNGDIVYDGTWQIRLLAPECDGKLIFGARLDLADAAVSAYQQIVLRRMNKDGTLDNSLSVHFIANENQIPVVVAQDPVTGKIVAVGRDGSSAMVLVRFNP